jgi:hypothetical protein
LLIEPERGGSGIVAKRENVVCVRLTDAEAADLDARRGGLSRTAYLRWLLLSARKQDLRFGDGKVPQFSD